MGVILIALLFIYSMGGRCLIVQVPECDSVGTVSTVLRVASPLTLNITEI